MIENHIHASIILNIHREAVFLKRTLLSLDEAAAFARSKGLRLELVAVLDRTDPATREVLSSFDLGTYQGVQIIEVDHGSLGLSRNAGINHAQGEYIFTADADDLVSYNYFYEIHAMAERSGSEALYFPEYVFGFHHADFVCRYEPLADVTPMTLIDQHPYISRLCAHRSIFDRISYLDVRLSLGYAYEDWHFNAEAVGLGLNILVVPDTILFYRQRPGSLLRAVDSTSIRQIPPTRLFKPSTYLTLAKPYHERLLNSDNPHERSAPVDKAFLRTEKIQHIAQRANAIEPSIVLSRYFEDSVPAFRSSTGPSSLGRSYYEICEIIQDREFSDVFLFAFMPRGGAEKYFLSLMETLYRINPFWDFLIIFSNGLDASEWMGRLPPNVVILDLSLHCGSLTMDQHCLLTLKILETCGPDIRVHLRESAFADRFLQLYGVILKNREAVYYRFTDGGRIEGDHFTIMHSSLNIVAEHLDYLSKVVCDNTVTIRNDHRRVGVMTHKWHCLPASVEIPILPPREAHAGNHILWASRFDAEKRPSLLPMIAEELHRRAPHAHIDTFGGTVFEGTTPSILTGHPNLAHHGPYDGFEALPLAQFSIFLYTSLYDGLPNVVLEAMSYGLAVIAPDVGGISEIIIDGETGILLPSLANDADMAALYVEALLRLLNDPDLSVRLGERARAFVREAYSPEAHAKRAAEIFGIRQREFQHA